MLLKELFTDDNAEGITFNPETRTAHFSIDGEGYTVEFGEHFTVSFHMDSNAGKGGEAKYANSNKGTPIAVFGKVLAATKLMIAKVKPPMITFEAEPKRFRIYKKMIMKSLKDVAIKSIEGTDSEVVVIFADEGDEGVSATTPMDMETLKQVFGWELKALSSTLSSITDATFDGSLDDAVEQKLQITIGKAHKQHKTFSSEFNVAVESDSVDDVNEIVNRIKKFNKKLNDYVAPYVE